MDSIINLGIPHVGELIFESIDTPELVQCALVSETWKVLAERVLLKRWKGRTFALFEACRSGEAKVVQLLLEYCNNGNNQENQLNAGIKAAAIHGHKDVIKLLLNLSEGITININARDIFGNTAFMIACSCGHKDAVQMFLNYSDRNIEVNAIDKRGMTALMDACKNGYKDVVQLLLDHSDIEVNAMDNRGETALMHACEKGQEDIVKLLLDHSDSNHMVNAKDINGWTPFMKAYINRHKNVVKLLLDYSNVEDTSIWKYYFVSKEIEDLIKNHPRKRQNDKCTVS